MRPKLVLVLIIAFFAYLFGARAGTSRYQQITGAFSSVWNDPKVKKARKQASKKAAKEAKKRLR